MRRLIPLIALVALALLFFLLGRHHVAPETSATTYRLLDTNLQPMATLNYLPEEWNGLILLGKTKNGYVYVPRETLYIPRFVDRLSLLAGKEASVDVPIEWWMERKGVKVEPLDEKASSVFDVVVRTPYEVIRTRVPVIGLYTGKWYVGKKVEANGNCIWVERVGDLNVPVLLEGNGIVDPEAVKVCRSPCQEVNVTVVDENGEPLSGWFTVGREGNYGTFFGKFSGSFQVCRCEEVRIHAPHHTAWGGRVCSDKEVKLTPLREGVELGEGIHMDILGALTGVGPTVAPPGAYRTFQRFPLEEVSRGLPFVDISGWLGYKKVTRVPIHSIVLTEDGYVYITRKGPIDPQGYLLCSGDVCFPVGGKTPVLCFGKEELPWDGRLHGRNCLTVRVK